MALKTHACNETTRQPVPPGPDDLAGEVAARTPATIRGSAGKRAKSKYRRCKKCKELVSDPDNCANCENRNPLSMTRRSVSSGQRGRPTLDVQEGNWDE